MAEQLKVVIDADVSKAESKIVNFGKVFTGQINTITNSANALSASVTTSIDKINSSLSSLKVTSVDISVDTSAIDASVQSIKAKFADLTNPEINVLANTELAEAKVKELLVELSSLKGSEIFIRANDVQALKVINEVEAELNSLIGKQIKLNVDTTSTIDANQRINALEKALINLEALKVSPNISSTQLELFEANIQRIKTEIASLKGKGVEIPIIADTTKAQANVNLLSETIETLRARIGAKKSFIDVETDITKIAAYNKEIQSLEARMRSIQNVGKKGFELFVVPNQTIQSVKNLSQSVASFGGGVKTFIPTAISDFNKFKATLNPVDLALKKISKTAAESGASLATGFTKAFSAVRQLAFILPGIGIAGIFNVAFTAISQLTEGLFKANDAAIKHSDVIEGASDSYAKAIANVNELRTNIQLAKEGFISKDAVVKQYNESIGKTTGFVNNLNEAEAALNKNADAYIKFTLLKAAANFALEEASKKAVKAALIPQEDIKKNLNFFQRLNLPFEKAPSRKAQETKFLAPVIAGVLKEEEDLEKIANDFQKKAAEIAKAFGFNFFEKTLPKDQTDNTLERARAFIKQFGEIFVVPDLEITFTNTEAKVKAAAKKLLSDIDKGLLITKTFGVRTVNIPIELALQVDDKGLKNDLKTIRDNLFKDANIFGDTTKIIKGLVPGVDKDVADRNKKFFDDFQKQILFTSGLVTDVLAPAFTGMFDAIVAGANPLKAFFDGLIQSVNQLIKKLITAAIQAAVLSALSGGGAGKSFGDLFLKLLGGGSVANPGNGFGLGGAIGSRSFQNTLQVVVSGQISGDTIRLAGQRAATSSGRFG